jgi:hypothetical protein
MPKTLGQANKEPEEGCRFLGQIVATNCRVLRGSFSPPLTQDDVAAGMRALGHDWKAPTVADLEHYRRTVHVEELGALSVVLGTTPPGLLDPGLTRNLPPDIDIGGDLDHFPIRGERARWWVYGLRAFRMERAGKRYEVVYGEADAVPAAPPYVEESGTNITFALRAARDRKRAARAARANREEE